MAPKLRTAMIAVFLLAVIGSGLDLILIAHHEDVWQWIPIVLVAAGLLLAVWTLFSRSSRAVLFMRWLGATYVAAGVLGVILHLKGNREFELEMYPDLGGMELLGEILTGATPVLAPGTLVYLGLFALLISFGAGTDRGVGKRADPR